MTQKDKITSRTDKSGEILADPIGFYPRPPNTRPDQTKLVLSDSDQKKESGFLLNVESDPAGAVLVETFSETEVI